MPAPDVVVIGGGIIGLAVADALLTRGARVTVLERRACGSEASGASAGMLAPLAEAHAPGPFLQLALAGLKAHPPWLERLRSETGIDAGPNGPGTLRLARNECEAAALAEEYNWQRELGLPLQWLEGAAIRDLEPSLVSAAAAVLSPREQHVQPPLVVRALAQSLTARGALVLEEAPVRGFSTRGQRVIAVRLEAEELPCGEVVIAGGAWTPSIAAGLGAAVGVGPIRGQILALSPAPMPIRHTVYSRAGYLVPKPDGRLIVGATEDHAGFDARPTAAGVSRLLAAAVQLMPALADAPFHSAWAGLRPACADRLPLLGPLPGWENVALATAHFRNGVLLAPLTGSLLTEWVLDRRVPSLMASFLPSRLAENEGGLCRTAGPMGSRGSVSPVAL